MKVKLLSICISLVYCCVFCSLIIPYPTMNNLLISSNAEQEINDTYEEEETVGLSYTTVPVLNLDWFEYMNNYFTKYITIRVIDIKSGEEYFVQRLGGYNHADVQAIDAQNTAKFKKIYGGQWSWVRRPVWVEIDGKFYAGSTNGMPHGFDILQTGEGGHTCIHFLNSKTHGTKRVDPDHQNCVKYASTHVDELNEYLKNNNVNNN
ncbi:MAG: hypothetical protein J6T74_09240 [Clostridia bacterium]|nr:hypothetical protein [Clostridia bacterium]